MSDAIEKAKHDAPGEVYGVAAGWAQAVEGMRPCAHGAWCEWSPLVDAAPDLLAACKAALVACPDGGPYSIGARLRAAIARAEGQP